MMMEVAARRKYMAWARKERGKEVLSDEDFRRERLQYNFPLLEMGWRTGSSLEKRKRGDRISSGCPKKEIHHFVRSHAQDHEMRA